MRFDKEPGKGKAQIEKHRDIVFCAMKACIAY